MVIVSYDAWKWVLTESLREMLLYVVQQTICALLISILPFFYQKNNFPPGERNWCRIWHALRAMIIQPKPDIQIDKWSWTFWALTYLSQEEMYTFPSSILCSHDSPCQRKLLSIIVIFKIFYCGTESAIRVIRRKKLHIFKFILWKKFSHDNIKEHTRI